LRLSLCALCGGKLSLSPPEILLTQAQFKKVPPELNGFLARYSRFSSLFRQLGKKLMGEKPNAVPVLGQSPNRTYRWLPKVKSRGHVYPLSYLPYF